MEDEEYARRLFEILTRPLDPDETVDAYGTGADRIERYDGFGTDVRVTSVDVVPGPYGSQLDIGFVLDRDKLPDDVPAEGSLLLPLAAEWRAAQGYDEPSAYAPWAAFAVMRSVGGHILAHRGTASEASDLPDRATQRAWLHEVLRFQGEFEELAPGRFVVRRSPARPDRTFLVTLDQWEEVVRKHGIRRSWLLDHFSELLASGHPDELFIVFWEGDLVRSTREELPPVNGSLRALTAMQAAGPPPAGAGWYTHTPGTTDDELPG